MSSSGRVVTKNKPTKLKNKSGLSESKENKNLYCPPIPTSIYTPSDEDLKRRRERFSSKISTDNTTIQPQSSCDSSKPVVGYCKDLEKPYFRLTGPPDPSKVRPEDVLKKAYKRLKAMWKEGYSSEYVLDQLKAIRQDLLVQHISNKLTIKVYEFNATVAIFASDMNELNQCQSMLLSLYKTIPSKHQTNFLSYNLLYDIIHNNTIDIHRHVQQAQSALTNSSIQHSILVLHAIRTQNYPYYLQLLRTACQESKQLMLYYLPTFRHSFIKSTLFTAFPSISLSELAKLVQLPEEELKIELLAGGIEVDSQIDIVKNKAKILQF